MKFKRLADLDDLVFRLECSVTAMNAVHTAMEEGPFEPANFVPAIFCIWDYQVDLVKQLRKIIDAEPVTEGGEETKK